MTQIESAKSNKVSPEMRHVSRHEGIALDLLKKRIKEGAIAIIKNKKRKIAPCAVGEGLRTKINANLGSSQDRIDVKKEMTKARIAIKYGADAVMDLSTGGDIKKLRKAILKASSVVVGT